MDKVAEAEPNKARKLLCRVPDVFAFDAEGRPFNAPHKAVFKSLLALDGRNKLHIVKLDLLPIAQHDDVVNSVSALKEHGHIAYKIYPVAVNAVKLITGLKCIGAVIRTSVQKIVYYRGAEGFRSAVHNNNKDNAEQKVHERACAQNGKPLPEVLVRKSARIIRLLILAHCAVAADGQNAKRILRFTFLLFENRRTHAYRKFIHSHTAGLCGCKVAEFMDGDKHAEHKYCDYYIH